MIQTDDEFRAEIRALVEEYTQRDEIESSPDEYISSSEAARPSRV